MQEPRPVAPLENSAADYVLTVVRGTVGIVPFAGPLLSELAGIVPNQRIDRIAKFVVELDCRMKEIASAAQYMEQLRDESCADLVEEGLRQAARSLSDERRKYIASLICSSLSSSKIQYAGSRHLLRILDEINDIEIIWLRSYSRSTTGLDEEFVRRHTQVLQRPLVCDGAPQEELDKRALQDSYLEHLVRLNLLEPRYAVDSEMAIPEFERSSGKPRVRGYWITNLGDLLLREIGLGDSE